MARPGHPAPPPECPPGWAAGPPDFVGIGADRSGTTWWHALVCSHPRVSVAPGAEKEVHFFDPHWDGSFGDADVERYREHFPREEGAIAGEWTPRYMYDVWTPALLARAAPAARLLVSLRDPLARYRSHLRTAIAAQGRDGFLGRAAALALSRSLYADPLLRVLLHFPRDRLLVLQHERCVADPPGELRRTFEFLGLDDVDWVPPDVERALNTGPQGVDVPSALEEDVTATFAEDLRRLREIAPEIDPDLWPGAGTGDSDRVQVVRDQFAAVNDTDFERAMEFYADDVQLYVSEFLLESGRFQGKNAVGGWFGNWFRNFRRGYRFDLEEVTDVGGAVLVVTNHLGHGRTSGAEVHTRMGYLYFVEGGKITRMELYPDRAEALAALEARSGAAPDS